MPCEDKAFDSDSWTAAGMVVIENAGWWGQRWQRRAKLGEKDSDKRMPGDDVSDSGGDDDDDAMLVMMILPLR